jgi:Glyoxalase-like domain
VIDHLVLATADLERTIASIGSRLGVTPVAGGQHVGMGTRNELVGLGGGSYLEIVGPDLEQPTPSGPRPFGIDELDGEALVAWCARPDGGLAAVVAAIEAAGHRPGPISAMSRRRPDGVVLTWRLTFPQPDTALGAVAPFLIDWGTSPHPALDVPASATVRLERLVLDTPDGPALRQVLEVIGDDERVHVRTARTAKIGAELNTPVGPVSLLNSPG